MEKDRLTLVFATNNLHKLAEVRSMVGDSFHILSLADIECHDEIPETAPDLEGNALAKARWVKDRYGYDCFADDTGLHVEALGGEPGVMTARYAGENCDSNDNMNLLLKNLADADNRNACFRTVIALILGDEEYLFEGRVDGSIATEREGVEGFGYDPVFIPCGFSKTFASLSPDQKNSISHRARAIAKLVDFLINSSNNK